MNMKNLFYSYILGAVLVLLGVGVYAMLHERAGVVADGAALALVGAGGVLFKQPGAVSRRARSVPPDDDAPVPPPKP